MERMGRILLSDAFDLITIVNQRTKSTAKVSDKSVPTHTF